MKKKRNAVRNTLTALLVLLALFLMPVVATKPWSTNCMAFAALEPSLVDMWVDRGCGGHYRQGEPMTISFKVSSPAVEAVVTIVDHVPDDTEYLVRTTTYTTNKIHSVVTRAACPAGIKILEVRVTISPHHFPSGMVSKRQQDIHIYDTCHYYVDAPCDVLDADGDGFYPPDDCDDQNPLIHPGAEPRCDGKDNDCDGLIDEGCYTCLVDRDGDSVAECHDCDDHDREVYPGAVELCDGKDNDCDGLIDEGCCICYDDHDRDGYSDCWDCNDNDPGIHPGAAEPCDGKDNDCDGLVDEGSWCDYVEIQVDRECGGYYDEGESVRISFKVHSFAPSAVVTITSYPPHGTPKTLISGKTYATNKEYSIYEVARCPLGLDVLIISATVVTEGKTVTVFDDCAFYVKACITNDGDGDGFDSVIYGGEDCDDTDPNIHPGAAETCDGKDNNCNGYIDEGGDCTYAEIWVDRKCGGYYDDRDTVTIFFRISSSVPSARVTITDYPPQGAPIVLLENRTITTNKVYEIEGVATCSGLETLVVTATVIVEGNTVTITEDCFFYVINCQNPDNDGDGYISVLVGGDDCDDADPDTHPGAAELCDGKDNNCDGIIDRPDNDKDGFTAADCGGNDCDDFNPLTYPGAEEISDGRDNDCDGEIDEGITLDQIDRDGDGYPLSVDCNDNDPDINPGAVEVCFDAVDNDCDGVIDCNDPNCEGDEACRKKFLGLDLTRITSMLNQYKYFLVGGAAGAVAVLLAYIFLRMRKEAEEEEEEELVPDVDEGFTTEERKEDVFRRLEGKEEGPADETLTFDLE